jgi:hypothetical protein
VRVAYVDTEGGPVPPAIGRVEGTPTIKAFVPRRSSARHEKEVLDYAQSREVADMVRFATARMPNYVEAVGSAAALADFDAKAEEWGLPRVLVFSDKASGQTASTLKALSAEFRRRVLIGELRASQHAAAIAAHQVRTFPALVCLMNAEVGAKSSEPRRFEGKQPTYNRLHSFLSKCALRKPVLAKASKGKEEL